MAVPVAVAVRSSLVEVELLQREAPVMPRVAVPGAELPSPWR